MTKILIVILIVLLCLTAVGGCILLNNMFPMADPIDYPDKEDIISISLVNNNTSYLITASDFKTFLQYIHNSDPTRQWSIQDYPSVANYYTIELLTENRLYRYFVYTEGSQIYIEHPYEGIYKADPQVLDFIRGYCNN